VFSPNEPELGLGEIENIIDNRFFQVRFDLARQRRRYSVQNNFLKRFSVRAGDKVLTRDGHLHKVHTVFEKNGLCYFTNSEKIEFSEKELHSKQVQSSVVENLFRGQWRAPTDYEILRNTYQSKAHGDQLKAEILASNRISLLDHQLYVAWQSTKELPVRVLLSDEVGLGKTIESGLIASILIGLGQSKRMLICCPDSLQNQWLSELYRRFNLSVSMFAELESPQEVRAYLNAHRHLIVPWSRVESLLNAIDPTNPPFDLLIIDEAHQLLSENFLMSEPLGLNAIHFILNCQHCLFLTATPKYLGNSTEFRLLNLLNNQEFSNYEGYLSRIESLKDVEAALKEIDSGLKNNLSPGPHLKKLIGSEQKLKELLKLETSKLQTLIAKTWGYGNTVIRNRRETLHFRVQRRLHQIELSKNPDTFQAKIHWLLDLLNTRSSEKFLLISDSLETAKNIHHELTEKSGHKVAVFHEDMDLIARDRAAEWFHDPEGARILVCSELGGEGRNFQYADALIFFDIPQEANLVEQRIGRLDRIGREKTVEVIVPVQKNSPQHFLLKWYDEALEIFDEPWNGELSTQELLNDHFINIQSALDSNNLKLATSQLTECIKSGRRHIEEHKKTSGEVLQRLLDLQSFDPIAAETIKNICHQTTQDSFIPQLIETFDSFDIEFDPIDQEDIFQINASNLSFADDLSEFMRAENQKITHSRELALARENLTFLSPQHPIVKALFDNVVTKNLGYASLGLCETLEHDFVIQIFYALHVPPSYGWDLSHYLEKSFIELIFDNNGTPLSPLSLDRSQIRKLPIEVNERFLESLKNQCEPLLQKAEFAILKATETSIAKALNKAQAEQKSEQQLFELKKLVSEEITTNAHQTSKQSISESAEDRYESIKSALLQTSSEMLAIRILIKR